MRPVPSFIEDQAFPGLAGVCRCREGTHTKTALWFQHGAFDNLIWPTFDTFIWPTLRP